MLGAQVVGERNGGSSGTLHGLSATSAPATSATESGTVCAALLTVASDDRRGRVQGDADLAEYVAGERVGDAEHAEQDVLVAKRLPVGMIERVGERHLQPRHDAEAAGPRRLERAGPERLLEPLLHRLEVDPE